MTRRGVWVVGWVLLTAGLVLLVGGWLDPSDRDGTATPTRSSAPATVEVSDSAPTTRPAPQTVRVAAVGDIGVCGSEGVQPVADLIEGLGVEAILVLGDLAYPDGTPTDFERCWEPAWGPLEPLVRPTPGNHDWRTDGAAGYFGRFGSDVGDSSTSWYAFEIGEWTVLSIDSNCREGDRCEDGSAQITWLDDELTTRSRGCILAFSHHPRFSSGHHGDTGSLDVVWSRLVAGGVDVVLAGHEHSYERMAPQDEAGRRMDDGTSLYVVGTGGARLRDFGHAKPATERRHLGHGALVLDLAPDGYRWAFHDIDGSVPDSGSAECVNNRRP